jgi:hypothetical protein
MDIVYQDAWRSHTSLPVARPILSEREREGRSSAAPLLTYLLLVAESDLATMKINDEVALSLLEITRCTEFDSPLIYK